MNEKERFRRQAEAELARALGHEPTPLVSIPSVPRQALDAEAAANLRSMTFVSRKGGDPHIVTLTGDSMLACTCPAFRSIETRPAGCWAMKAFRSITGMVS